MIIVTGSQHSGKTTVAKYVYKHHETWYNYIEDIKCPNTYKLVLEELSNHKVVECNLQVAFAIKLLEIDCKIILVKADREIKYQRLNANGLKIFQYTYEFDEADKVEKILNPDFTLWNNNSKQELYETIDKTIKPRISGWL